MQLSSNYIKVSDKVQSRRDISSTSKLIYSDLAFKMRLSFDNGKNFYDKKHGFYVIYKVVDLAKKAGCSKNAVIRALKLLESKGLILRIRLMHFTRIFMPGLAKFHNEDYQSSETKPLKRTKNIKQRTTKNTGNTINTKNRENSEKSIQNSSNSYSISLSKLKSQEPTWNSADNRAVRFELLHQRLGLPKAAASEMITDVGDDYYEWCHVMISAKRQAMKYVKNVNKTRIKQKSRLAKYHFKSKRNASWFKKAFRFEDNEYLRGQNNDYGSHQNHLYYSSNDSQLSKTFGSLANQIRRGLWKAIHKITKPSRKYKTVFAARAAYFAKSMKDYLIEAATSYINKHCRPIVDPSDRNLPRIPIFKL